MWNPFRRTKQLPFADDFQMQQVETFAQEFYSNILEEGDEPLFVSDEASVLDVSSSAPAYLQRRCAEYYGVDLTMTNLRQSFWSLLRMLDEKRRPSRLQRSTMTAGLDRR